MKLCYRVHLKRPENHEIQIFLVVRYKTCLHSSIRLYCLWNHLQTLFTSNILPPKYISPQTKFQFICQENR